MVPDDCVNFLVAGLGIAFSAFRDTQATTQGEAFFLDARSKERGKLIGQNIQGLIVLTQYFKKSLGFSHNIQVVESTLQKFKRDCEFGEKSDLFVYEFDLSEIFDYLASCANRFSQDQIALRVDIFTLPLINLVLLNYFIQLFVQIDILWKIQADKLKEVSKLQISHFQDKTGSKHLPKGSLYLFVGITFKHKSSSL